MVSYGIVTDNAQDGAEASAIQAEVGKLQELKASLAAATAATESTSTFDRKGKKKKKKRAQTFQFKFVENANKRCSM